MSKNPSEITGEVDAVTQYLRDGRPEASELELDRIKRRAIAQASTATSTWVPRKGLFMKPRIAVVAMLAMGLLMSGTGATLAVISDSGDASKVQYPNIDDKKGSGVVLGSEEESPVQGASDSNPPANPPTNVQEERQVGNSGGGDELPFTGFLAIPLLIIGVLLLVAGGVMRTRTRTSAQE